MIAAALALSAAVSFAQPAPRALTLRDAVAAAVDANLQAKLAKAQNAQARARALQAAAALLPRVNGSVSQTRVFKENLAALGLSGPGPFPQLLGPFDVFDARVQLVAQVLDWSAAQRFRSARADERAAGLEEALAREQVAAATELAYVEALRSKLATAAAESDESLSAGLLKLAQDNRDAGLAAGIDVARARTREAETRLELIDAQTSVVEAELRLKRVAGIPLSTPLLLSDALSSAAVAAPDVEEAVGAARRERAELAIVGLRLRSSELAASSAGAQRLPTVSVSADEGLSGSVASDSRVTGSIGAALRVPLFSGGLITGQAREARAKRDEADAQAEDMALQVEEDARLSVQRLAAAGERAVAAAQSLALAQDELQMARDRFAAGVGDNVEVLNAQTALARARAEQVAALAQQSDARINLALALGKAGDFRF